MPYTAIITYDADLALTLHGDGPASVGSMAADMVATMSRLIDTPAASIDFYDDAGVLYHTRTP